MSAIPPSNLSVGQIESNIRFLGRIPRKTGGKELLIDQLHNILVDLPNEKLKEICQEELERIPLINKMMTIVYDKYNSGSFFGQRRKLHTFVKNVNTNSKINSLCDRGEFDMKEIRKMYMKK